jgi:hypothetical protein
MATTERAGLAATLSAQTGVEVGDVACLGSRSFGAFCLNSPEAAGWAFGVRLFHSHLHAG